MRARAVGGLEPDDAEQLELVNLWHLSRTALSGKPCGHADRITWCVDAFLNEHPGIGRKWVYVWIVDNVGCVSLQ